MEIELFLKEQLKKLIYHDCIVLLLSLILIIASLFLVFKIVIKRKYKVFFAVLSTVLCFHFGYTIKIISAEVLDYNYIKNDNKPLECIATFYGFEKEKLSSTSMSLPVFIDSETNEKLKSYNFINIEIDKLTESKDYKIIYTPNCKVAYIIY